MYYWYLLIVGDCDSSHNENIDQRDSHQPISRMGWDRGVFYGLRGKWVENGLGMIWGPKFRLNISQSVSFFSGAALLKYAAEDLWPSAPKVLLPNFFIFRRQLSKNRNNPKKNNPNKKSSHCFGIKKPWLFLPISSPLWHCCSRPGVLGPRLHFCSLLRPGGSFHADSKDGTSHGSR